jgi:hypothetical protein
MGKVKGNFQIIRVCLGWCARQEKEIEKDLRESFVKESEGSKLDAFPKGDWAHFPRRFFCLEVAEIYC